MGTACSTGAKTAVIGCSDKPVEVQNTSMTKKTKYNMSSIICSTIWNPFRISREDAENLLQESYPGAFIFSHNVTSEIFLSMSTGKYVCHHPILRHAQCFEIGGRNFNNIEEAIKFYRMNRLGDSVLTEQFYSNHEESTEAKHGFTSPKITKSKHVTFNTSKKMRKSVSINSQVSILRDDSGPKTTQTAVNEELSSQESDELFKKIVNKPRKSICRVQPEESLSTSSENMFKEEEF